MSIWDLAPGTTHLQWFWTLHSGWYWEQVPISSTSVMYFWIIVRGIRFQGISWALVSTNKIGKFIFYLWLINLHSCLGKLFLYCSWCWSSVRFSTFLKKSQTSRLGPRYHTFAFALAFVFAFAFAFGLVLGSNLFDQCLVFFDNCKGNYISRNLLWCCLYKQDWQVYFLIFYW